MHCVIGTADLLSRAGGSVQLLVGQQGPLLVDRGAEAGCPDWSTFQGATITEVPSRLGRLGML